MKQTTSPYIEVKNSKIHGKGIFARIDIPKKAKVIEYVGEKITKAESDKRSEIYIEKSKDFGEGAVYVFELDDKYDIDGNVPYNTARLINHSCDPNCETEGDEKEIWIQSKRDIKKGEEITYDYGYDIEDYEDHPCKCLSENCIGYIIDKRLWPRFHRKLRKKYNRTKNQ